MGMKPREESLQNINAPFRNASEGGLSAWRGSKHWPRSSFCLLLMVGVLSNAFPSYAGCNLPPIPRPGQTVTWAAANRGVVDEKFLNRARNRSEISGAKVGDVIGIGGPIVAEFANTVADCATALMKALDKWLIDNLAKVESS
jgi:hypothetical protein